MATEGAKEVSISDDGVLLEVYEVQDNASQDCMMLVQKLSETNLGANEREMSNLTELLAEAQKEVASLKASLKTANSSVDDLTNRLQQEKDEKLKTRTLLESTISEGREKDLKLSALEKESCEQEQCMSEVKKQVTALETERHALRKEVEGLRGQNEDADEQIGILNSRLQKERQKLMVSMEESEEQMICLKDLLHDQRQKLEDLKGSSDAELLQLREKLTHQQKLNESLSVEADENTACMLIQIDELKQTNQEILKDKRAVSAKVVTLQEELAQMSCELNELKERCASISLEKERRVEELNDRLRQKDSECETLAVAKEEAELKQKEAQTERDKLECRLKDLQQETVELLECSGKELSTPSKEQEDDSPNTPCEKENETGGSGESEPSKPKENDWKQLYCQLQMDNSNLHKQYLKLKKHRNQILRENTNQKQQMQMAVAQLTSNNTRFHRQMEQLRMQLGMAEAFCQEKAQEAQALELQLQQMLFQNQHFERSYWSPVPVQRHWHQPTRYADGNESWRIDG